MRRRMGLVKKGRRGSEGREGGSGRKEYYEKLVGEEALQCGADSDSGGEGWRGEREMSLC